MHQNANITSCSRCGCCTSGLTGLGPHRSHIAYPRTQGLHLRVQGISGRSSCQRANYYCKTFCFLLQFWSAQFRGRRVVEQAVGFSPRPQGNCLRSQGFGGWHGPHSTRRPDNLRVQGHGLRAQGESVASFAHVYWFACVVWARVHVFPVESSIAFCTPLKTVLLLHALVNIVLSCEW